MVSDGISKCPNCGGYLRPYDKVTRVVRTKRRETDWVELRRMRCERCGRVHREIPDYLIPYKQYEADLIQGVMEGLITTETYGYEDYPCEMTMIRWRSQNLQAV